MIHLVKKWLDGKRSYTYGAILYNQFGSDEKLKALFAGPATEYTTQKLLVALQDMVKATTLVAIKPPVIISYDVMPEDTDSVLAALRKEWMPKYTEMNIKRHQLDKYLEDEFLNDAEGAGLDVVRGKLAMEILTLEKECMAIWAKRDHYTKHKELPGKSTTNEPVIESGKAFKQMENLKKYIRRDKLLVKAHPDKANFAALLKKHEDELEQLTAIHGKQ